LRQLVWTRRLGAVREVDSQFRCFRFLGKSIFVYQDGCLHFDRNIVCVIVVIYRGRQLAQQIGSFWQICREEIQIC